MMEARNRLNVYQINLLGQLNLFFKSILSIYA